MLNLHFYNKQKRHVKVFRNDIFLFQSIYINLSNYIQTTKSKIVFSTLNLINSIYQIQIFYELPMLYLFPFSKFLLSNFIGKVPTFLTIKNNSTIHLHNLYYDKSSICKYFISFLNSKNKEIKLDCYGNSCINLCDDIKSIKLPTEIKINNKKLKKIKIKVISNDYMKMHTRNYLSNIKNNYKNF